MTASPDSSARTGPGAGAILAAAVWLVLGPRAALADDASGPADAAPTVAQDFQFHCAACHGADGRGDGPVARTLKIEPPDLTRIAERRGGTFPEDAIFEMIAGSSMPISHGTREMPVWGDLFVGETLDSSVSLEEAQEAAAEVTERIRRLVKYLETIQIRK
ncbi:c-type cytochrome [Taklimakanibacter lacteus]|uniref:c-type cytochrome n=1 Tax=Taklimakanibacter lacteus TaxID=2268456 RepID=UPI0013C4900D